MWKPYTVIILYFIGNLFLLVIFQTLLTTERSEVVPFFRAVWPKERGREATPIVLRVWGHPPFVSFLGKTWSKRQRIWTKLGRNDLWAKPDGITRPLFLSATRGLRYLALKVEK